MRTIRFSVNREAEKPLGISLIVIGAFSLLSGGLLGLVPDLPGLTAGYCLVWSLMVITGGCILVYRWRKLKR